MQEQLVGVAVELVKSNPIEVGTSCLVLAMAFSYGVRTAIKRRDGGCTERGNGLCCGTLEAAHDDHDKGNPNYDSTDNGRTLCTNHHLEDHMKRAGENGLTEQANDSAIGSLVNRLRASVNRWED